MQSCGRDLDAGVQMLVLNESEGQETPTAGEEEEGAAAAATARAVAEEADSGLTAAEEKQEHADGPARTVWPTPARGIPGQQRGGEEDVKRFLELNIYINKMY